MSKANTAVKAVPDPDPSVDADRGEEPVNLNAAVVTLEWGGKTFTIPKRRGRWPTKSAREFARGNDLEAIVVLLGEDAYAELEQLCPFVDDLDEFANYAGEKIKRECIP